MASFPVCLSNLESAEGFLSILGFREFNAGCLSVYTDSSLRDLGIIQKKTGAAVFFEDISLGLGVKISGLLFSTLIELQVIALVLECVSLFNFCNWYWVEHQHIVDIIHCKNLKVEWLKVKSYLSVMGNDHVNAFAAFFSLCLKRHCLLAGGDLISGNFRHFVQDVFRFVHHMDWEVGSNSNDIEH
ncbi:hypothetical protein G9A89_015101 [Geosiphon pyriformis]|nr:hypothetical protein G9A89_015101 [Geosiphon pyriformis]